MVDAATPETSAPKGESRAFEADVSRLLHLMVHSVYSDRDIFLRELVANGADACEKLRTMALQNDALLGGDTELGVTIACDPEGKTLTVSDNGVGMSHSDLVEALGTIARSGTRAFLEQLGEKAEGSNLIGQFGVGFYSAFMVARSVDVLTRKAGAAEAWKWSSDGQGAYTIEPAAEADAPARGTRVVLHLSEGSEDYAEPHTAERIVRQHGSAVPVPVDLIEKPGAEKRRIADGTAIWTKSKSDISAEDYTSFYQSVATQFDEPALTIHYRAEGRHEYNVLAFVPSTPPLALFDPLRKGRMKLYVRRMFISDELEILPGYLRFVSGVVDSADLPLNLSRETIQDSPILAAIRKGVTNRVLSELDKLADKDAELFGKVWTAFGPVLKEGLYEDYERRDALFSIARFATSKQPEGGRSLKSYVAELRENQTDIWYLVGDDAKRLAASPHLEGFRARGIEVLLLSDPVDAFWVQNALGYEGKPFKSVTQGSADIANVPLAEGESAPDDKDMGADVASLLAFVKQTLGDAVSDVRPSTRLAESAACLVAGEHGPDRGLERLLAAHGKLSEATKPVLEVNPRHGIVASLAARLQGGGDKTVIEDASFLLLDQARAAEGQPPVDAAAFAQRLTRLMQSALA
ncbi:chaperone protein HtpG [Alsobacter metallidurans]|uniref:Chaperone protein HtpG n=1 Tax=Alsobacter metallidurans TaxID=340221 RepID=A0A917MLI9_9HYPH|nr:molecular chaperone HtpG [Alsobacter metallidurans]GGH30241.1 chaperone protein HtpG [Alsobacter metallidurans]